MQGPVNHAVACGQVSLRETGGQLPPPPRLQRDRAFPPSLSASSKSTDEAAPRPSRVPHLCFYSGNVVRRLYAPEAPASVIVDTLAEPNRLVQFEVHPTSRLLIAQLVQPGGPVENIALPVSPEAGLRLVIDRGSSGEYRMEAHLKHHAADMLLQYSCNGATSTAATAGRSQAVDGEHLLREKMADPIAAAVGAYSILRIGDLARLHDWTAHLRERFAWLPDGAAIHGEHLARMGRHEAALDAFAQVPMRGLPFLSDGLFYAVERLKLYVSRTWKGKERVDADRAKVVLDELQPFATLMRRQRPISTYPGLDVAAPDTAPASESFTSAQSRDLQTWFSPYAQNDETRPGSPAEAVGG